MKVQLKCSQLLSASVLPATYKTIVVCCALLPLSPLLASTIYNPSVYNMAILYDFPPVPGKIKELTIEKTDQYGKRISNTFIQIAQDGCIESIHGEDKLTYSEFILRRDGDYLKGVENWSPLAYELDNKCNILVKNDVDGTTIFNHNENGFIKNSVKLGKEISKFLYNNNNHLATVIEYNEGKVHSFTTISYPDALKKPSDSVSIQSLSNGFFIETKTKCTYSNNETPTHCQQSKTESGEKENIQTNHIININTVLY